MHAVDDPRHEIGAPTDERRITCERALRCDEALAGRGKKRLFTVAIDPGAAILMTISIGIGERQERKDVTGTEPERTRRLLRR